MVCEFVRMGSKSPWKPTRQYFYKTEKVLGEKYEGLSMSGVSALCALGDGSLLVLSGIRSCPFCLQGSPL